MVEFIAGGVKNGDNKGEDRPSPTPLPRAVGRWNLVTSRGTGIGKGTPEEKGKDSVFGRVSSLANAVDDGVEVLLRDTRHEPANNRADDAGGAVARGFVG